MLPRTFSYYHRTTGVIHGKTATTNCADGADEFGAANAPDADHAPMDGDHARKSLRVDLAKVKADHEAALTAWRDQVDELVTRHLAGDVRTLELPPQPVPVVTLAHVVDHKPEQPSEHHEWNGDSKRWQLTASRAAAELADRQARAEIRRLEQFVQPRALREFAIGDDGARKVLIDLDAQIAELRKSLLRGKAE